MKRLLKINKLFDGGYKSGGDGFDIFKNPTIKEIELTKNADPLGGVRGVCDKDGTMYIWPSYILHDELNRYSSGLIDTTKMFRFSYDPSYRYWMIDSRGTISSREEIETEIKKNIDKLNQIYSGNNFEFFSKTDNDLVHVYYNGNSFDIIDDMG